MIKYEPIYRLVTLSVTVAVLRLAEKAQVEVAVMVALPTPLAVTTPVLLTEIMLGFEDAHTTPLLVALAGKTVALSVRLVPLSPFAATVSDELCAGVKGLMLTDETGITLLTEKLAVRPFTVLAVIVALPERTALTVPLASTVATLVLEEVQVTFRALRQICSRAGVNSTRGLKLLFALSSIAVSGFPLLVSLTLVGLYATLNLTLRLRLPAAHVTVIIAFPRPLAVTTPF